MKRFITISLIFIALFWSVRFVTSCCDDVSASMDGKITYLVCGYDDAAENTDVLALMHYDSDSNSISIVQIPRDTYYSYGSLQNKINQIYALERSKGKTKAEAMNLLTKEISHTFGLDLDGYIGVSISTFVDIVDSVGGVDIDLPYPLTVRASDGEVLLSLKEGTNHLSGNDAILFVRHRSSYLMGDIGRIDAQKIFASGMLRKLRNEIGVGDLITLYRTYNDKIINNIGFADVLEFLMKNKGRIKSIASNYATLPGQSVQLGNGVWYYSVCKSATASLFDMLGISYTDVDSGERLLFKGQEEFANIYHSDKIKPNLYDDDSIGKISPKKSN